MNVKAVYCGIMDLKTQVDADIRRKSTITVDFMGGAPSWAPDLYIEASPINHVRAKAPAIWIAHGTDDDIVPVDQSRRMVERLRAEGNTVVYQEAPGRGHTMTATDNPNPDNTAFLYEEEMLSFVRQCLNL
ncbi:MAG: prolyl oligopeptidase family serine peptidase [Kiritimatiellae bacterium]|jgi:dipeptidyl aminopeptidase/acylaminoacyl peptidase|nr:prolyl oligopeptidase family serine peptidase [Kiritimatiellia bacterium]